MSDPQTMMQDQFDELYEKYKAALDRIEDMESRPDPLAQLEGMVREGNIIIGANEGRYYAMHLSGGNAEGTTLAAAIDALARKVGQ